MNHSFNVEIATRYGFETAVLLENFYFWVKKNEANKKNIHDGRAYTYNTAEALGKLFPYIKPRKIAQVLRDMEAEGLLISGQFNKYDRTKSYTLSDLALSFFEPSNIQKIDNETYKKLTMKHTETCGCLNSDINTDNKQTDINTNSFPEASPLEEKEKPKVKKTKAQSKVEAMDSYLNQIPNEFYRFYYESVELLYRTLRDRDPSFVRGTATLVQWRYELAKYSEKTGRTAEEIYNTMKFAMGDQFWSSIIFNAKQFLSHYEKLIQRMKSNCNRTNDNQKRVNLDDKIDLSYKLNVVGF